LVSSRPGVARGPSFTDSPLEEAGFDPSVPRDTTEVSRGVHVASACFRSRKSRPLGHLAADWQDGREKLFISYRLLELRRRHPALFAEGDYQPIEVEGERSTHICAFSRNRGDETIVVAVPRLVRQLYGGGQTVDWGATEIIVSPRGGWQDVLTGRKMSGRDRIRASELLGDFPVSVLFA
jgi:(1->4)-alpha-D-glucan 1-alpha-D-glucosylmutase